MLHTAPSINTIENDSHYDYFGLNSVRPLAHPYPTMSMWFSQRFPNPLPSLSPLVVPSAWPAWPVAQARRLLKAAAVAGAHVAVFWLICSPSSLVRHPAIPAATPLALVQMHLINEAQPQPPAQRLAAEVSLAAVATAAQASPPEQANAIAAEPPQSWPAPAPRPPPNELPPLASSQAGVPPASPRAPPTAPPTALRAALPAVEAGLTVTPPRYDAAYLSNPAPAYPATARRFGQQGTVWLRVRVLADGNPAEVQLRQSSGFAWLDQAALSAVRHWRFVPATQEGQAVAAWVQVPLTFSLGA